MQRGGESLREAQNANVGKHEIKTIQNMQQRGLVTGKMKQSAQCF